jgi:rhodanese-related sulfurtransferase
MTKFKFALASIFALVLVLGVSACSPGKLDVTDVKAIIDIRTPEDFATSHIVGSINFDFERGDYLANVSLFERGGKYYLYGSSEEQSASAMDEMFSLGFTNVINLGSYEDAQRVLPLGITK